MGAWQTILFAFGGNAALLAVLGLLGKSLLEKLIVRDTKQYEADLKIRTDSAIEQLKNNLMLSVESYKVQLKKSEFFFEREYAAAQEFTTIVSTITPRPSWPDMEWHDALEEVIDSFEKIERRLHAFLISNSPILTDDERKLLRETISIATTGNFHAVKGDPAGYKLAESLCENIQKLETQLIKRVREQSSL